MNEHSKITSLKGIGEKTAALFQRLGIYTLGDLIRYYPRSYDVYEKPISISDVEEGKTVTITGTVFGRIQVGGNSKMQITSLYLKDLTGTIKVVWYRMPFLRNTLSHGGILTLRGRIARKKNELILEHPEIFYPAAKYNEKLDTLQPIYSLTTGLTNAAIIKAIKQTLDALPVKEDLLPEEFLISYNLCSFRDALFGIHFPHTKDEFYTARNRLVFEEFLLFILSLRISNQKTEKKLNPYCIREHEIITDFLHKLPYNLTNAQQNVWNEIKRDMTGIHVMSKLVQGDVGSGKTIIAFLSMLLAGINGYQAAMMAPTEVLARQHFENIINLLKEYNIPLKAVLLTGSMTAKEKRIAYTLLENGEANLIIGTHALIQEKVVFHNLALVVTDEQHRFGVRQREILSEKGLYPHILVMSATPIPRTLAIILYGGLDISVINELPKNRLPIKNCVVDTGYRNTAYNFMKKQVLAGRQCYVICPMVEESENLEAENVIDYTHKLQESLGTDINIAYLHGKMRPAEKDQIMEAFGRNEIQILVSTTVIEVGIDVSNATTMLIENAERFGLAQLHQLRGRVGRGAYQSYCIFMTGSKTKETKERLDILNHSNDGFYIASEDLKLRGPGDLFGIRQSGLMDFKLGDVYQDAKILQIASNVSDKILDADPNLIAPEHRKIKEHILQQREKHLLEKTL